MIADYLLGVGKRIAVLVAWLLLAMCLAFPARANTTVRISTTLGDVDVTLYDTAAPATVANFLNYVNTNAYADAFFHRLASGFVLQGGGFTYTAANGQGSVTANPPVVNEFGTSNTRGTLAMAKLGGDPDSATNQWFFNLDDNSGNLDAQNGGFTVFGRVVGNGMNIIDAIAALPAYNLGGGPFGSVPLTGSNGDPLEDRLIFMNPITTLSLMPGDYNGNGLIEQGDLDLVLQNWGATASQLAVGLYGHGPGQIGQASLDAALQHWGTATAPDFSGSPVPEPAALALLGIGGLALLRRRA